MRLRLYCNRYGHFKDALVCSVNCVYRTRCQDFALFYDDRRAEVDALVGDYFESRRDRAAGEGGGGPRALPLAPVAAQEGLRALFRLEVLREMAEAVYIWVDREDRAELVETAEVLRRAERGQKPKHIYKVAQEMELRFQLVPRKRIEKARRSAEVEAERTQARRSRSSRTNETPSAPVQFPAPVAEAPAAPAPVQRRARTRAKVG